MKTTEINMATAIIVNEKKKGNISDALYITFAKTQMNPALVKAVAAEAVNRGMLDDDLADLICTASDTVVDVIAAC